MLVALLIVQPVVHHRHAKNAIRDIMSDMEAAIKILMYHTVKECQMDIVLSVGVDTI